MNTPHIHAVEIKAWAEGALIEYYNVCTSSWHACTDNFPGWFPEIKYRVKGITDPLQEFKDAFKAGKEVQWQSQYSNDWYTIDFRTGCAWDPKFLYRMKPKTLRFRNFLWKGRSGAVIALTCSEKDQKQEDRSSWSGFIQWIGDWQEVELPS